MKKTIFVKAPFQEEGRMVKKKVGTGRFEKKFLAKPVEIMETIEVYEKIRDSPCKINGEQLAKDVDVAISKLEHEGYTIESITPITSGGYYYYVQEGHISSRARLIGGTEAVSGSTGYNISYGYSYTEGVMILAKKNKI